MNIVHLQDIPEAGISHNPEIKKRVMIGNGAIPNLTTFAEATFKPGQSVELHAHATMHEVFFILSGKAVFHVNGKDIAVVPGDCITINAGEMHSQRNPHAVDVVWLYFGIATD